LFCEKCSIDYIRRFPHICLPERIPGYFKIKLHAGMCFILPTFKAIITIYLEYLGAGPLTQLAYSQSKGLAIDLIVVCNRHILFLSFLHNLHTLRIGESRCATGLAPDATTGEKVATQSCLWCEVFH
jgi:hypothetical protein